TGSLNIRVDEVENTLSVKADKQTVDDLTGVVDLQALDIKANADGLKLKANQDTVDLIDGRVSSLGTEVGVVAGQISNKVWKTDIESAVDGIEVGGRNLLPTNYDLFTVNDGNYGWIKLAEDETDLIVKVYDTGKEVDMACVFFGITKTGKNYTGKSTWLMASGVLQRHELKTDSTYFSFYPKNKTTFDKIFSRFKIKVERGTIATD